MRAYSSDLRERLIRAVEAGDETQAEIAERFDVSLSFIEKLLHRWRESGSLSPLPHGGGRTRVLAQHSELIREEMQRQPDITLDELSEKLSEQGVTGHWCRATICNELQRLNLRRKRNRSTRASGTPNG